MRLWICMDGCPYRRRIESAIMGAIMGMISNPDFISINNISIVPYYVAENIGIGIMPLSLVPQPCLPLSTNAKKTPLRCPFHTDGGELTILKALHASYPTDQLE